MAKTIRKRKARVARVRISKRDKARVEADKPQTMVVTLKDGTKVTVAIRLR